MRHLAFLFIVMLLAACGPAEPSPTSTVEPPPTAEATLTHTPTPTVTVEPLPTSTVPPPTPTMNPAVSTAAPGDILFIRPGGGAEAMVLGIDEIELWAVGPDGSNERLITTYRPQVYAEGFTRSPDGRYVVVSDPPGVVLIDLQAGVKIPLTDVPGANHFMWGPEGAMLYYSGVEAAADDTRVNLYRQQIRPLGSPDLLIENLTVPRPDFPQEGEMSAAYPAGVLPDGRVLLGVPQAARFITWGLYDPAADVLAPFERLSSRLIIHDARGEEIIYTEIDRRVYVGRISPTGEVIEERRLASAADGWGYISLIALPEGRVLALRSTGGADAIQEAVIFEPDGSLTPVSMPGEVWSSFRFRLANPQTLIVQPDDDDAHWLVPLDGGEAVRLGP